MVIAILSKGWLAGWLIKLILVNNFIKQLMFYFCYWMFEERYSYGVIICIKVRSLLDYRTCICKGDEFEGTQSSHIVAVAT